MAPSSAAGEGRVGASGSSTQSSRRYPGQEQICHTARSKQGSTPLIPQKKKIWATGPGTLVGMVRLRYKMSNFVWTHPLHKLTLLLCHPRPTIKRLWGDGLEFSTNNPERKYKYICKQALDVFREFVKIPSTSKISHFLRQQAKAQAFCSKPADFARLETLSKSSRTIPRAV